MVLLRREYGVNVGGPVAYWGPSRGLGAVGGGGGEGRGSV